MVLDPTKRREATMTGAITRRGDVEPQAGDDEELKLETEIAEGTGLISPVSWWGLGLVALLLIAVVLLAGQLAGNGGRDAAPAVQTNLLQPRS